jgi:hypothetical protein
VRYSVYYALIGNNTTSLITGSIEQANVLNGGTGMAVPLRGTLSNSGYSDRSCTRGNARGRFS